MCGIAGLIDPDGGPIDRAVLTRMTETLRPRGPDQLNVWTAPGVGLGHTRLKVIDLSEAAAQPFHDDETDVHLVFNGEIYNFQELRADLIGRGHSFRSRSDTEVLLRAYIQWQDGALDRIDGMFAFVLWDGKRRRVFAARDRMGKKPLHYAQIERPGQSPLFAFGSELKALGPVPGLDRSLSPAALSQYLTFEYVPPPLTILAGVRKLAASQSLTLDLSERPDASPQIATYWRLPFVEQPLQISDWEATDALWGHLRRAVEKRLVADVPLGVFLSGGIDSSAITAAAASLLGGGQSLSTFAIGFSDPSYDESNHAQVVAQHLGCRHRVQMIEPQDLLQVLPDVGRFLDEPLGDASIIPTYVLSRFARRHVTVVLGGDGGDELFSGYPTFLADRFGGPLMSLAPAALHAGARRLAGLLKAKSGYFSFDFKVNQFLRGGTQPGPIRHQRWMASFLPEEQQDLLSPGLFARASSDPLDVIDEQLAATLARRDDERLMDFYARFYLAGDVNVKVDRAAGACGLEVRAPFLDTDLVTFACQLPARQRVRGLVTKFILRRTLLGRLPGSILARGKRGFALPVAGWLRGELLPALRDELAPDRLRREGLFQPETVQTLIDEHAEGRRDHRKRLWTLFTLHRWLAEHRPSL